MSLYFSGRICWKLKRLFFPTGDKVRINCHCTREGSMRGGGVWGGDIPLPTEGGVWGAPQKNFLTSERKTVHFDTSWVLFSAIV